MGEEVKVEAWVKAFIKEPHEQSLAEPIVIGYEAGRIRGI
jgi:hypothetical protein